MDAPTIEAANDIGSTLLKLTVGIVIAIVGAVLWDMNERLKYLERNALTPETLKENLREVITETDRKRK